MTIFYCLYCFSLHMQRSKEKKKKRAFVQEEKKKKKTTVGVGKHQIVIGSRAKLLSVLIKFV